MHVMYQKRECKSLPFHRTNKTVRFFFLVRYLLGAIPIPTVFLYDAAASNWREIRTYLLCIHSLDSVQYWTAWPNLYRIFPLEPPIKISIHRGTAHLHSLSFYLNEEMSMDIHITLSSRVSRTGCCVTIRRNNGSPIRRRWRRWWSITICKVKLIVGIA